jgi:hypothetical protein
MTTQGRGRRALGTARGGNGRRSEEHRVLGGQSPQRRAFTCGPPAGLIDVRRRLVKHSVMHLGVPAGQCVRSALTGRARCPGRDRPAGAHPRRTRRHTPARLRVVIDDLIDLTLGPEFPARAAVVGLPIGPAVPRNRLRRFRPSLRSTLPPRLRRIRRRRLGTGTRGLARRRLQPPQPILMLLTLDARSRMNCVHASRPESQIASASTRSTTTKFAETTRNLPPHSPND